MRGKAVFVAEGFNRVKEAALSSAPGSVSWFRMRLQWTQGVAELSVDGARVRFSHGL